MLGQAILCIQLNVYIPKNKKIMIFIWYLKRSETFCHHYQAKLDCKVTSKPGHSQCFWWARRDTMAQASSLWTRVLKVSAKVKPRCPYLPIKRKKLCRKWSCIPGPYLPWLFSHANTFRIKMSTQMACQSLNQPIMSSQKRGLQWETLEIKAHIAQYAMECKAQGHKSARVTNLLSSGTGFSYSYSAHVAL